MAKERLGRRRRKRRKKKKNKKKKRIHQNKKKKKKRMASTRDVRKIEKKTMDMNKQRSERRER